MFELRLNEQGQAELVLALELAALEFEDWRPEFRLLEPESTLVIDRRFEQEGPGWLKLSEAYAARKAREYPGKTILRRTDTLFLSFAKGEPGNYARIEEREAEFGSVNPYGGFQPNTRLIVKIEDSDEERFLKIITDEKSRRLSELGFDVT